MVSRVRAILQKLNGPLQKVGGLLLRPFQPLLARFAPYRTIATFIFLVLLTSTLGSYVWYANRRAERLESISLQTALEALDEANYGEARRQAHLLNHSSRAIAKSGGPAFILGAIATVQAENPDEPNRDELYRLAVSYLHEARNQGFPPGRQAQGLSLLGSCLLAQRKFPEAAQEFERALRVASEYSEKLDVNGTRLKLAWAYGSLREHNNALVAEHLQKMLSEPGLPDDTRFQAICLRTQLLIQADEASSAREQLKAFTEEESQRPKAVLLRGHVDLLLARRASLDPTTRQQLLDDSHERFRTLLSQPESSTATQAEASYLLGLCLEAQGQDRGAREQFNQTRRLFFSEPQSLAASLREGQLLMREGNFNVALDRLAEVVQLITENSSEPNRWLTSGECREVLLKVFSDLTEQQKFPQAFELLDVIRPLSQDGLVTALDANLQAQWGEQLVQLAAQSPRQDQGLIKKAERRFRAAGQAFADLAEERFDQAEYPADLLQSGRNYLRGQSFRQAAVMFRSYLQNEVSGKERADAYVWMGEAYLAMGHTPAALDVLKECLTKFPTDPARYQARLLASQAYLLSDDVDSAERMLRENLEGDGLTPASLEWRDSLFALGRLMHLDERYLEAAEVLDEALQRYPEDAESVEARYLAADCCWNLARQQLGAQSSAELESTRSAYARQVRRFLYAAREHYTRTMETLEREVEQRELPPLQDAILRNCYFGRAAVLLDMENYEEALAAYRTAITHYQNAPEVLEAYVQMAECYRQMQQPQEARSAIQQAKGVLARLPADAPFALVTSRSRQQWTTFLDWYGNL